MRLFFTGLAICLSFMMKEPQSEKIAIIAHAGLAVDSVDADFITKAYTLTFQRWEDGSKITVFNYKDDTDIKTRFYAYIDQKPAALRKVWLRYQLTGEGRPPRAVKNEKAMLDKVAETEGAIGYVALERVTEDVKIITIVEP